MTPRRSTRTEPQIVTMPDQKMAVAHLKGAPDKVFAQAMPALYGAVYTLKMGLKKAGLPDFKVSPPRARYPDAHLLPMDQWAIDVGVPIPDDTTSLTNKVPTPEIKIETWEYGTVAQILHLGSYDEEREDVEKLQQFIRDSGYEPAGEHEEEYLTRPEAKLLKTMIRYRVRKK